MKQDIANLVSPTTGTVGLFLFWFSCAFGDMVIQIARRPLQPGSREG